MPCLSLRSIKISGKSILTDADLHLDNGVNPLLSSMNTKHERLAYECSRPEVQGNCLPGQKWRCERDGHRWRRHKCKYTNPQLPIQPSITVQKTTKKCACFTPNGVVYTRLESNDFPREHRGIYDNVNGFFGRRGKRSINKITKKIKIDDLEWNLSELDDRRDRRAIDEEDDDDFLQELKLLTTEFLLETKKYQADLLNLAFNNPETNGLDDWSPAVYPKYIYKNSLNKTKNYEDYDNLSTKYTTNDFDLTLNNIVTGTLNVDDVIKRHRRVRRSVTKKDTIEHVTKIMESIEEELDDLNESQIRQSNNSKISPKCLVMPKGGVNCTLSIYKNPNEWKISRRQIEKQIKEMRMQLESLKEIRRHLMDKRPHFITEIDDDYETISEVNSQNTHQHHSHHHQHHHNHHHHHQKNHTGRHHKKHEKPLISTTSTSTQNSTNYDLTGETPFPKQYDRSSYDSATQGKLTTIDIQRTTLPTTIKPRKNPRKPKINKASPDNRGEDDDRPRRRKTHHHKPKNHTLLTNSVHDDILNSNSTTTPENNWSFATLETFEDKETTDEVTQATRPKILTVTSSTRQTVTSTTTTTTSRPFTAFMSTRKPIKTSRNRTGLGPARIDVTILEPPDRRHKQSGITSTSNNGRLPPMLNTPLESRHKCYCEPDNQPKKDDKEFAKEEKRRLKEERLRKKERKMKKKAKLEKECLTEKMNCFEHDNDHWRTAPLWNAGPFCFCMNANNNTYSCLRTINITHNFLYCEFTTGLATFYNLRLDPFEQWNRLSSLTAAEQSYLHDQLEHLKGCKGTRDCTVGSARESITTLQIQQHPRFLSKRKYSNSFGKF